MKLIVEVMSGVRADGFDVTVMDGEETLYTNAYRYGYNCSYDSRFANIEEPYVSDVLQSLIDTCQIDSMSVEAGRNTFAGKSVGNDRAKEFWNKYCRCLTMAEDNFTKAVEGLQDVGEGRMVL